METNVENTMDGKENKPLSRGGGETKTSTRSKNPPTKITIFRSCYESKITTGTGHYAWSSCRMQRKPRMLWVDSIKEATGLRIEVLKEISQDRKKWREIVKEKIKSREHTNIHRTQEEAMQTIPT
jgi:hypothetical protein